MAGPKPNAVPVNPLSRVWITLVTRSSYLPGLVLLIHTLYKHSSVHPLIVQYTASLPADCTDCLQQLTKVYPLLRLQLVEPIALPQGLRPVATRFDDTLTKLRAFEPIDDPRVLAQLRLPKDPQQACFLAHHQCVRNVDNDPWAPPEWSVENCSATPLKHPSALEAPEPSSSLDGARPTYQLLNSGVFVCSPSRDLWDRIEKFRVEDARVQHFTFPDQNFLDEFFRDRWIPIGWQYNAFKTHRYWHPAACRDEEARALHYVVDKPWQKRIGRDGVAGYLGRDGVTHGWWWKEYSVWEQMMQSTSVDVLNCVKRYVAPPLGLNDNANQRTDIETRL